MDIIRVFFCKTFVKIKAPTRWLYILYLGCTTAIFAQNNNDAILFEGAYTLDFASNLYGGVEQGFAYLGNIDLTLTMDTQKLGLWEGGQFFIYALNNHGNALSPLMGDFQIANNIEADSNTRLYQFWYQHRFKNGSFIMGQHDLNSVFAYLDTGGFFINSSFGIQPDLSANIPISIFPVAGLGAIVSLNIASNWTFTNGIYDGEPGSESSNPNSLKWTINKKEGALFIHELSHERKRDTTSTTTYKLGLWNHTQNHTFNEVIQKSSQGVYFLGDKKLTNFRNQDKEIGIFTQIGFSLSEFNPVKSYWGTGFTYKGLFTNRMKDVGGLAVGHTRFSKYYQNLFSSGKLNHETALECSYEFVFSNPISLKPSVQYIINPASNVNIPNALMALVRMSYSW